MSEPIPIRIFRKDVEQHEWSLSVWDYTPEQKVWGLWYYGPTHMSYRWPEDNAKEIIIRNEIRYEEDPLKNPKWLRWYFDVGRELYAEFDDLVPVCKQLGIWDDPS